MGGRLRAKTTGFVSEPEVCQQKVALTALRG